MVEIKEKGLLELFEILHDEKNVDFTQYKDGTILRRIASRMKNVSAKDYIEYGDYIKKNLGEIDLLLQSFSINVTEFFRNPEMFDTLKNRVIPEILKNKFERHHKIIRAWSCACATGDEPYSLAITILEALGEQRKNMIISIFATDINDKALKEAEGMVYTRKRIEGLSDQIINKYFDEIGKDAYKIKDFVSTLVRFRKHDVIKDHPFINCDVILCRNLLIYFNRQLQEETLLKFFECLNPGGFLALGMMESLSGEANKVFEPYDNGLRIYQRSLKDDERIKKGAILSQGDIDAIVKEFRQGRDS